jgi:acyl-CoA thioester hydrolase
MPAFRTSRIVEFADTDMAGIVHFANFFRYMEAAEHAYLRGCGLEVFHGWHGQTITFPRVNAGCDFLRPARFAETLDVEVRLDHLGRSSVRWAFTFSEGEEVVARGQITAVLCRVKDDKTLEPFPLPAEIRERLERGPG